MSHSNDPFAPTVHTAHHWLNAVAQAIGTEDHHFAYRVLRAWLHAIRDRIGVPGSAHLTAQLPELIRGLYYESWIPARTADHSTGAFVHQFAHEANVSTREVPGLASAVTDALTDLCSPGQLDHVFAVLPIHLCDLLRGTTAHLPAPEMADETIEHSGLEHRLRLLGDAVAVLSRALMESPPDGLDTRQRSRAAQQAHNLIMAEDLTTTPSSANA
ncbi:DUF2267 domain-containing protein [Nocardia miyunensis]|uniref:DUF2267 domain-containing protein n=1 Tax=Nocardia miyunensis TaxID=282684 RepID=UPI00082C4107|nr:DUF2267 domain-containing protein [Nocardia miyunensis]